MNLQYSFRSELLKIERTSSLYLAIFSGAAIPLLMLVDYSSSENKELVDLFLKDPWSEYYLQGFKNLTLFFLPLFIVIVCTLLPQIEYRNKTWKQVYVSPQKTMNIFFSKFLVVHYLILIFFLAFNVYMIAGIFMVNNMHPSNNFTGDYLNWNYLLRLNVNTYVSILAISALQFWLGLRFRNFIVPISIGLGLIFIGVTLIFDSHYQHIDKFPFAFPVLSLLSKYERWVPRILCTSVGLALLFLLLAYTNFSMRRPKA